MDNSTSHSKSILIAIVILALASQACAISLLDIPLPDLGTNPTQPPTPASNPTPQARAEVKLSVQLPDPLLPGEVLAISVLDEVTGLSLNSVDYQLSPADSITYTATFPIPDHSVIKYRYVRLSGSRIFEDSNSDTSIRYRMMYVNGNTSIVDTINSWSDKPVNTLSGSITGKVLNSVTGAPIPEMLVTAGGVQALTDSSGRFTLNGLRGGSHNLVVFALDGTYLTFQQGAQVEGNKTTPVEIRVNPTPLVNVSFIISVPPNTQRGVPLRMAGSLQQFGNTFADLRGGTSVIADRMPVMQEINDGRYSVSMYLPAGAYLEYKYTLGDGFWNSEFNTAGQFVTRSLVIPSQDTTIEETIQSWQAGPNSPILFEVDVPTNTPTGDIIYIQFNALGWSEPIPMWRSGTNHWAYKLFGPLNILGSFGYRYCRNAQCGVADDSSTAGNDAHGKNITSTLTPQNIRDTVKSWTWSQGDTASLVQTEITAHGSNFVAGAEFQSYYAPSMNTFISDALQNIQAFGANWIFLNPTWTITNNNPIIFSQKPGLDPFLKDTNESVALTRALNMNAAIFPEPRFSDGASNFWNTAPRDAAWWDNWFNHYRAFAVHFADIASLSGAQAIVLGGDWIGPALPNGNLDNGSSSGVPADAEARWQTVVAEVRQHYKGLVLFALPYTNADIQPPINLLRDTDGMYLLWFAKISESATAPDKGAMVTEIGRLLDDNVFPIQSQINKPLIMGVSYPSSTYSATGCLPGQNDTCLDWTALNQPSKELGTVQLNLQQQFDIYEAMLNAINNRAWVSGLVTRGYFPPVALKDKSASVHGKPAADLLWYWFPRLLGNVK